MVSVLNYPSSACTEVIGGETARGKDLAYSAALRWHVLYSGLGPGEVSAWDSHSSFDSRRSGPPSLNLLAVAFWFEAKPPSSW